MTNPTVSIVLNGYKRPNTLNLQIRAVKSQTIGPNEILLWKNNSHDFLTNLRFRLNQRSSIKHSVSSENFGVWARFAYSLMAQSDFICVLDDDTIPGKRWIENCLNSFSEQPGLYGTIGVRFNSINGYDGLQTRVGWDNPNDQIEKVGRNGKRGLRDS